VQWAARGTAAARSAAHAAGQVCAEIAGQSIKDLLAQERQRPYLIRKDRCATRHGGYYTWLNQQRLPGQISQVLVCSRITAKGRNRAQHESRIRNERSDQSEGVGEPDRLIAKEDIAILLFASRSHESSPD